VYFFILEFINVILIFNNFGAKLQNIKEKDNKMVHKVC